MIKIFNEQKVTAIILAAGNSIRYGTNTNKNFELINNKMVLSYSLKAFDNNNYIDNLIIATRESDFLQIQNIIKNEKIQKETNIVIGGDTRKKSVYNCIKKTSADIVIIHDGARPCIKQENINMCIENMKEFKGATIGVKAIDTIKIADENNIIVSTTEREHTWIIQTPQCFDRKILLNMHEKYINTESTDDCSLLEKDNYKIKIIQGDYNNIKITNKNDIEWLRKIL